MAVVLTKDELELAVVKSMTGGKLSLDEAVAVAEMSIRDLMVEHGIDHLQAQAARRWVTQELQRHRFEEVSGNRRRNRVVNSDKTMPVHGKLQSIFSDLD